MSIYQGDQKVANNITIENTSYSMPIGTIISYASTTLPVGFLLCDGSEVSKIDYADLYAVIGSKFGTATDTTKFKLPDLRDKFIQGANGNLGTTKEAGLPNITGEVGYIKSIGDGSYWQGININTGVFKSSKQTVKTSPTATTAAESTSHSQPPSTVVFKASDSNSIYGNSDTVQPPAVCLHYIIKASKVSDQSSDIIDDTANTTDKTWSAKKISESIPTTLPANGGNADTVNEHTVEDNVPAGIFASLPFKWKLIGTSSPETSDTSTNVFKQTMSGGSPFCVYHSSGVFCFGNGVPANRGTLYGMTTGVVASVTYTAAGLLSVEVGSGTAYIYEMETIN